jgi:DNA-binding CsgD family transcriptional regulator
MVSWEALAGRHREAADLAYEGFSARHIASRLGLSESAARRLIQEAFAKLGVQDRKELREKWTREMWELTFDRIRRFVGEYSHSDIPADYSDEHGGGLGELVANIRHHHAGLAGHSPGPFPGVDYASDLDRLEGWDW